VELEILIFAEGLSAHNTMQNAREIIDEGVKFEKQEGFLMKLTKEIKF